MAGTRKFPAWKVSCWSQHKSDQSLFPGKSSIIKQIPCTATLISTQADSWGTDGAGGWCWWSSQFSLSQNSAVIIWWFATLSLTRAIFIILEFSLEKLRFNPSQDGSNLHQNGLKEDWPLDCLSRVPLPDSELPITNYQFSICTSWCANKKGLKHFIFNLFSIESRSFTFRGSLIFTQWQSHAVDLQFPIWNILWHTEKPLCDSVVPLYCNKSRCWICSRKLEKNSTHSPLGVLSSKQSLGDYEMQFLCKVQRRAPDSPKFIHSDLLSLNPGNSQYSFPVII